MRDIGICAPSEVELMESGTIRAVGLDKPNRFTWRIWDNRWRFEQTISKQVNSKLTDYERGVLFAVITISSLKSDMESAVDVFTQAGMLNADVSGLEDCDKASLSRVNQDDRVNFIGLP